MKEDKIMIRLIRKTINMTKVIKEYMRQFENHIDDYYKYKENSIIDHITGDRLYYIGENKVDTTHTIALFLTANRDSIPRIDYLEYGESENTTKNNVFFIMPEYWYRELSWFDRYAMFYFMITEVAFLVGDECIYEENSEDVIRACKVFPDFISPVTNHMINVKVNNYNKWISEKRETPPIYTSHKQFKNTRMKG